MDETKLRELLHEWADGVPGPGPSIPRSVLSRARRRVATNVGAAVLATGMLALGAVGTVRAFVNTEVRRPATPRPIVAPGTRITLLSATHILLANPDGTDEIRLASIPPALRRNGLVPLAWSPDGARLLVRDLHDDTIAVMNADGGGLMYLAGGVDASWSPDGKRILVAGGRGHIYLMKPDGSDYDQLSFGTTASFSTNGEDATVVATTNPPDNGIWVVGPAVGSWREAEFVRVDPDGDAFADGSASWAPDGTRIAIASYTSAKGWRIYLVKPDGTGLRYLANGSDPSWSPDGSRIAFSLRTAKGNDDVYVIGADGSGLTRLTSDPSADNRPSWSPVGSTIAFFSARDGQEGIYVMNPDGTDQRFVGSFPFTAPAVVWRITGG